MSIGFTESLQNGHAVRPERIQKDLNLFAEGDTIKYIFMIHNEKIEDKDFKEEIKHLENNLKKRLQKIEEQNISKIAIINKEVDHQGIGGKEIILEKELIVKDFLDTNFNEMSIAMFNFIKRRLDFINEENENKKVYYGHVGNLGYFVAEDEIEMK